MRILIAIIVACFALSIAPAQAQVSPGQVVRGIAAKNQAPSNRPIEEQQQLTGANDIGEDAEDKLVALREKTLADLKYAAALAHATNNTVTAPCWDAWVELLEKQGQPLKDKDGNVLTPPDPGLFTKIEKVSQLRQALSNGGPIQTGCAPLKDAARTDIRNLVGLILGGGVGLAKMIPIIP